MRHRSIKSQKLLESGRESSGFLSKFGKLCRIAKKSDETVPDEACGRVVAGNHELKYRRQKLLAVQSFVAVSRTDQCTDEIVAGCRLLPSNETPQVATTLSDAFLACAYSSAVVVGTKSLVNS